MGPAPRSYVLGLGAELGGCGGAGSPVLPVSGITGQGIPQGKEGDGVWRNDVGCLGWGSLGSGETWGVGHLGYGAHGDGVIGVQGAQSGGGMEKMGCGALGIWGTWCMEGLKCGVHRLWGAWDMDKWI